LQNQAKHAEIFHIAMVSTAVSSLIGNLLL
jgi:hypothetical protein